MLETDEKGLTRVPARPSAPSSRKEDSKVRCVLRNDVAFPEM